MRFGYYNELRRYNEKTRAEKMDAIIAKVCIVALVAYFLGVIL